MALTASIAAQLQRGDSDKQPSFVRRVLASSLCSTCWCNCTNLHQRLPAACCYLPRIGQPVLPAALFRNSGVNPITTLNIRFANGEKGIDNRHFRPSGMAKYWCKRVGRDADLA
jgi:hypothetical protein